MRVGRQRELAHGCAAAGVDGRRALDVRGRHGAVRGGRDDSARRERSLEPRRLVGEVERGVEVDGLAAADAARRQRQARHAVAQLVRVLAPVDVAVADAHAFDRERRRCSRRRRPAAALRLGCARRVEQVLPVAAQRRVAREVQRQAVELDGADLDAARQERQQLHARGDAARRRERLRGAAEVGRAADGDAAGLDGEPREVGEAQIFARSSAFGPCAP